MAPSLTAAKAKAILAAVEGGSTIIAACLKAGTSPASWYRAQNRFPESLIALKKALAANKEAVREEAEQTIRQAFATDWKAAAWWLERVYPNEYGRHHLAVEHSGQIAVAERAQVIAGWRELLGVQQN